MLFLCVNIQRAEESRCVQADSWLRILVRQRTFTRPCVKVPKELKRSEKRKYATEEARELSLRRESDQSGDEVSDEESELSCSWMEETLLLTSKYFYYNI